MATEETYVLRKVNKGKDIAHAGTVKVTSDKTFSTINGLVREVKADVTGNGKYAVMIRWLDGAVVRHACACPSHEEGECKHVYGLHFWLLADALIQCEVIAHA